LCSLARFDFANWALRQTVLLHTFCARLLVFHETSAQPDFAVVNCSDLVMSVFLLLGFNAQLDIFAVMNCCAAALSSFSSDTLAWGADNLYSVQ